MRHLRRVVALLLLTSVAGLQSASASCVMGTTTGVAEAMQGEDTTHVHHSSGTPHVPEPASSGTHSRSTQPPGCGLMMACSAAAPTWTIVTAESGPFTSDSFTAVAALAYTSPSVAFDPPPPRRILI